MNKSLKLIGVTLTAGALTALGSSVGCGIASADRHDSSSSSSSGSEESGGSSSSDNGSTRHARHSAAQTQSDSGNTGSDGASVGNKPRRHNTVKAGRSTGNDCGGDKGNAGSSQPDNAATGDTAKPDSTTPTADTGNNSTVDTSTADAAPTFLASIDSPLTEVQFGGQTFGGFSTPPSPLSGVIGGFDPGFTTTFPSPLTQVQFDQFGQPFLVFTPTSPLTEIQTTPQLDPNAVFLNNLILSGLVDSVLGIPRTNVGF